MTVENRMRKYASAMDLDDLKGIIQYLTERVVEDAQMALTASTPVAGGEQQMHHWEWRCMQCGGPVTRASWGPDLRCLDASHGISVILVSEETYPTYPTPGKNRLKAWAVDKAVGVNADCAAHMSRWSPAPVSEDLAGRALLLAEMAKLCTGPDGALVDFIKLTALSLLRGQRSRVDFPAKWREIYD
jgi:hypothetical protein